MTPAPYGPPAQWGDGCSGLRPYDTARTYPWLITHPGRARSSATSQSL